jgi:hypothetical protein
MRLARYKQAPIENRRHVVDYSQWLDTAETIVGTPTHSVDNVTSPPLTVGTPTLSSDAKSVIFFVSGGVDGEEYQVDLTVTTSGTQVREDTIIFTIDDPDV